MWCFAAGIFEQTIHVFKPKNKPLSVENDFELSKAIVFILVEYLTQPLEDMRGLRSKYNIITFEDLFNTLAKVYME